jgi:urease accessory protein
MTGVELVLMLLADARLPTSAHTQSGGLEPALNGGLDPEDIPSYCRTRLETVTLVEASTAVVARYVAASSVDGLPSASPADVRSSVDAVSSSDVRSSVEAVSSADVRSSVEAVSPSDVVSVPDGVSSLELVEAAWAARTPSDAIRAASYDLGRAYRRLALRLWPAHPAVRLLDEPPAVSRAVALGAIAAATGLSAEQLVRLVGYDDVQTVVAAALKLVPFDPVVATQWVLALSSDIELLVPLAGLTRPEDIPAPSAPLIEAWAQAHAQTTRRLFRA